MRLLSLLLFAATFLLNGCTSPFSRPSFCYDSSSMSSAQYFINANHAAVDRLLDSMPLDRTIGMNQPILVASLVGIDGLKSSRFGKTVSEHMASRLTNRGYRVIELKLRNSIFIQHREGEFLLSRELKDIMKNHNAQAALVGTYSESSGFVYVTAKIVGLTNGISLASTDYHLCIDSNIHFMLSKPSNHEPVD